MLRAFFQNIFRYIISCIDVFRFLSEFIFPYRIFSDPRFWRPSLSDLFQNSPQPQSIVSLQNIIDMDSITTQAVKNILTQKLIKCRKCSNYILGEGDVTSAGIENSPSIVAVKCESCPSTKRQGCVFVCRLCTKCNQLRRKMKCNM